MVNYFDIKKCVNALPCSDELKGKKVLLVTLRSFSFVLFQEMFFANIYARKGAEVWVMLDDGQLPHWDTFQAHNDNGVLNSSTTIIHRTYRDYILSAFSHKNVKIKYFSKFADTASINAARKDISEADKQNCISSVRRYFENGKCDLNDTKQEAYYAACLKNCSIVKAVTRRVVSELKPDVAITSHGIYSLWGTAYEEIRKHNIPIYVYGAHAYASDAFLFTDSLAQTLCLDSDCTKFMDSDTFNAEKRKKIEEYFENRRSHKTKDTSIYYSWMDEDEEKEDVVGNKNQDITTYCVFPNIIWDGDVAQRDTIFDGALDHIIKTVNYFRNTKDVLYVRCHPAEATLWKDSIKLLDVLEKEVPDLYDIPNVKVIRPEWKLDTYEFVREKMDVGIVYDGILALEITAMGKPVISPSTNRFSGRDFLMRPTTQSGYFGIFDNPVKAKEFLNEERMNEMLKYSYWFIFEAGYYMPVYDEKEFGKAVFNRDFKEIYKTDKYKRTESKLVAIAKQTKS